MQESCCAAADITVFVCTNCEGAASFGWPEGVRQVVVPCTGRLQPEHMLKAFEAGADAVCAIGCEDGDCHYLEGSKRCTRRVDYLRALLDEIGLGGERLLRFQLKDTAAAGAIRDQVLEAVEKLPRNPLDGARVAESSYQEVEISDDDNPE
jgi:F420-non-reducing hydrogenase iron-sulfur subunit